MEAREADRFSTILGFPCRIMQPLGTPKPREECQPFTFEFAGNRPDVKAQEYFMKGLNNLGQRCSRCSRKGKNCSESRSASVRHACLVRQCS